MSEKIGLGVAATLLVLLCAASGGNASRATVLERPPQKDERKYNPAWFRRDDEDAWAEHPVTGRGKRGKKHVGGRSPTRFPSPRRRSKRHHRRRQ